MGTNINKKYYSFVIIVKLISIFADMKMLAGDIKMVKFGIIPNQPSWQISVGQFVGGKSMPMKVVEIVLEPVSNGKCEFHIQCCLLDKDGKVPMNEDKKPVNSFTWKTYKLEPDEIEYFAPDENHNFLVVR